MRPSASLARIALASLLAGLVACSRDASAPTASAPASPAAAETPADHPTVITAPALRERLATRAPALAANASALAAPFNAFAAWSAAHAASPDASRLAEGLAHVRARRAALKTLAEHDPELALRLALDAPARAALPPAFAPLLETPLAATARYDVDIACGLPHAADSAQHATHPAHEDTITRVATIDGVAYRGFVYGGLADSPSRPALAVTGIAIDDVVALADSIPDANDPESAFLDAQSADSDAPSDSAASPHTEGAKTLLYIRVTFSDLPAAEPLSLATAQSHQANVDLFYRENSYDLTSLTTTFTPTLVLPQAEAHYNDNSWTVLLADARAAALAAGYPSDNYDFYTVATKKLASMTWAGRAFIGGAGSHLNGDFSLRVAAHEFGHNFGLYHANYNYTSGESPTSREAYASAPENSPSQQYGHRYHMMGASGSTTAYHFSAREKVLLDWLPPADSPVILASGVHRLYRNDHRDASGLRSLRIPSGDPVRSHFWLSYRHNFSASTNNFRSGAEVLWGRPTNVSDGTLLIDTTPFSNDGPHADSSNADNSDKTDAALTVGRMFGSPDSGAWFTILDQGGASPAEYLDVAVEVGNFSKNRPPVSTLAPSTATLAPNQSLDLVASASDPDSDTVVYSWDFGDGTFAGNQSAVSKSWSATGHYVVRLVAVDQKGGTSSARCVVRVGSPTTFTASGRVLLADGSPVEGVRVFNGLTGSSYRGTRTDSDGHYTIPNLPSGTFTLHARKTDHVFAPAFTNPASISADTTALDFTATTAPAPSIIVDNTDPTGVEITATTGSWVSLSSASGFYASDYLTDNNTSKGQKQITYRPDIPAAGLYRVYFRYAQSSNRATNVPVDVSHLGGVATFSVDQTSNGGLWNYLGTFEFAAGSTGFTRIRTDNTNGHVSADAFKFELTTDQDPTVRLQTIQPAAAERGLAPALLRIEREGPLDFPLTVHLATDTTAEGAATAGEDFVALPASVTLAADVTSLDIPVTPLADTLPEGDETLRVSLRQPPEPSQEWDFDETSGTELNLAANTFAGGATWTDAIAGVTTTGSGSLRVRRAGSGTSNTWAVLPAALVVPTYVVLETTAWKFDGTSPNETIRLAFTTGANTTVVAQATVSRDDSGVYLAGDALGTGAIPIAPALVTPSITSAEPCAFVLAIDPVAKTYRVSFRYGATGAFTHVGSGLIAADRTPAAIRLSITNSFTSTSSEKFDIGRIALSTADPTQPAYVIAAPSEADLVIADDPRDAWRFHAFDPTTLADPALVAWTADPDGDGLSNLHEYAFGRSPLTADASDLTPVSLVSLAETRHLAITFTRRTDDPGLVYTPEATGDLATPAWPHAAAPVGEPTPYPDTPYESVIVRDPASLDAFPRRFLRVRVEFAPPSGD